MESGIGLSPEPMLGVTTQLYKVFTLHRERMMTSVVLSVLEYYNYRPGR